MATPEQYAAWIVANADKKGTPEFETVAAAYKASREEPGLDTRQRTVDQIAGAIRGAGSIGATLLRPNDLLNEYLFKLRGANVPAPDRRSAMDGALQELGADPNSGQFKATKLGTEVLGSSGAGPAVGGLAAKVGLPRLGEAIASAGMKSGGGKFIPELLTRATGGAISGGVTAGIVDPEQAKTGATIGGAIPLAAKTVASGTTAAGNALRGTVSTEVRDLAARAKELGIDIPIDRLLQSKPLDAVASGLNYLPFSGRAATEARMNEQLNLALSRTFGQNSSNVTAALRKAEEVLGSKFDATLKSTGVKVDQQLLDDVFNVFNTAEAELGDASLKAIRSQVNEILNKGSNGVIDGQAAYNIKRTLDRIGRGNDPNAWHALELKSKLMDALNRSLPDGGKSFALLREQYSNMLALQKLAKNGVEGEISAARLANVQNINNKPLQELADIAAQFVKPREGQHGAMQRAVVGLTAGSMGGVPGVIGTAAVGRAANTALNSNTLRATLLNQPRPQGLLSSPDAYELLARPAPLLFGP